MIREEILLPIELNTTDINAAFSQPDNDGSFRGALRECVEELAARKSVVLFAFPPKAAGTFLRTAAIAAIDGQLMRIVHAQGGRDAQPYLPTFIAYYLGAMGEKTCVTHVHMQGLPANLRFIEALGLKPIVMLRSIPDMLASYWDMLESDDAALEDGLNCRFPSQFRAWRRERQGDFLVDIRAPWYAGYFATWLDYAQKDEERVLVLDYTDFANAPARMLERALAHSGLRIPRTVCET